MGLPRVILAEKTSKYDLSAASTHGVLVALSDTQLNPFSPGGAIGIFSHRLKSIGFNPDEDLICLTGSSITVALLLATVAQMYPTFKMLMFHAGTSDYRVRIFSRETHNEPGVAAIGA